MADIVRGHTHEPVPVVEPLAGRRLARGRTQVPLADHGRRVPKGLEHLRDHPHRARWLRAVVVDMAHALPLLPAAGHEQRPRLDADRRGIGVDVVHAPGRNQIDVGRDRRRQLPGHRAVRRRDVDDLARAEVVGEEHDDVRLRGLRQAGRGRGREQQPRKRELAEHPLLHGFIAGCPRVSRTSTMSARDYLRYGAGHLSAASTGRINDNKGSVSRDRAKTVPDGAGSSSWS